jgi:hypothetical protein
MTDLEHTQDSNTPPVESTPVGKRGLRWYHITLLVIVTIAIATGAAVWIIKTYVFPSQFRPVELSAREERVLDAKIDRLDVLTVGDAQGRKSPDRTLEPEPYSEEGATREISFTERELNALAKNTDLAHKLALDLSDNLISAKLLVRVDEDFPILGGKTLKVRAGVETAFAQGRPIVVLKGVSIMGVPVPNAWLGGLKNIDLVAEYGNQGGFWKAFADGVENIRVEEGQLKIKLKE